MFRRGGRIRPVRPSSSGAALDLALRDPLSNALAGSRLAELAGTNAVASEFSIYGDDALPRGVLWHGVNLSPLAASDTALAEFGRHMAGRARRCSSVVGPRRSIELLWEQLAAVWAPQVREYRWSQPLLVADGPSPAAPTPAALPDRSAQPGHPVSATPTSTGLRPARPGEADLVFPAAVSMFREEVGVDPLRGDGGRAYRARVAELIRTGRTYVVVEAGQVVFKADVGSLFGPVAQIHGVWVRPSHRRRGLGRAAMAELVPQVRSDHAPQVSLYVNAFNEPARRAYAAAGFRQVGELSTILF